MKRSHRSLLISLGVVILALGSLWIYQNKPKQVVPEHSDISLLCWPTDEIAAFEIQNKEGKRGFRRQGEVWKSEEGVPIDSPKLDVQLAQLRQSVFRPNRELQIEHTGIEGSADHWIFQSESERCLIELGLVNQVTGERLIRRQFHSADLGSVAQKSLLRLDWDLAADRLAYIDQGAMTSIHLAPEIADSLQFDRQRGFWRVRQGDFEMIGDEEAIKELLHVLTKGLVGTWLKNPPALTEPDLMATISTAKTTQKITFYNHESGYLARDEAGVVFRLNQNPLAILRRELDAYRDRQVIRYKRGQVDHFVLISEAGRFRYDRKPQKQGPDRWFLGKRELKDGYRLAALQWDLHTLRAKRYLGPSPSEARICLNPCRQVQAIGFDGEMMVDLKLWPEGEDYEAIQKNGNRLLVGGKEVAHWPFQAVP